jgi:hypothetical protein
MNGIVLLLAGGALGVISATVLRPRAPRPVTTALLALAGSCLGAGALLAQDESVNAVNWAATLLLGALFLPVHVWIAFGPPRAGARS